MYRLKSRMYLPIELWRSSPRVCYCIPNSLSSHLELILEREGHGRAAHFEAQVAFAMTMTHFEVQVRWNWIAMTRTITMT